MKKRRKPGETQPLVQALLDNGVNYPEIAVQLSLSETHCRNVMVGYKRNTPVPGGAPKTWQQRWFEINGAVPC